MRIVIMGVDLPVYALLLTTELFLGGLQLLSIGVLDVYLDRDFIKAKGWPLYVIESTYTPASPPHPALITID